MKEIGQQLEITQMAAPIGRPFLGRDIGMDRQESQPAGRCGKRQRDAIDAKSMVARPRKIVVRFRGTVCERSPSRPA